MLQIICDVPRNVLAHRDVIMPDNPFNVPIGPLVNQEHQGQRQREAYTEAARQAGIAVDLGHGVSECWVTAAS